MGGTAAIIIVGIQEVHRLEELILEDERSDNDQRTEDIPTPEGACAEAIVDAASVELITHTCADAMPPYQGSNTEGERCEDEEEEQIVHRLLTVILGDLVDLLADVIHHDEIVDTEGEDRENDPLEKSSIGA